ncbi:hypothetical protein ABTH93_20785, partial [Acinetobacter baumannii]
QYIETLAGVTDAAAATFSNGASLDRDHAIAEIIDRARASHAEGGRIWFVGNGGSAAIASHMANDWTKNGGIRAMAITDGSVL